MKLHSELTARTIFRRQPRTHHRRTIYPELFQLSTQAPSNSPTAGAAGSFVGRVPELLMAEQTHSAYASARRISSAAKFCDVELVIRQAVVDIRTENPSYPGGQFWKSDYGR